MKAKKPTKQIALKANTLINCGSHEVSIGTDTTEIAIFSKTTGEFCKFKDIKKGGKLAKIKRKFKKHLISETDMVFKMQEDDAIELIEMLKK